VDCWSLFGPSSSSPVITGLVPVIPILWSAALV
jgi:hypothetical protein